MIAKKQVLRLAVTPYKPYLNDCVLNARNFSMLRNACGKKEPGISVTAATSIIEHLSQNFEFQFVPVLPTTDTDEAWDLLVQSFSENQTDMALDLWDPTPQRQTQVTFSSPLLFYQEAFIVSGKSFKATSAEIVLNPFDLTSFLFVVASYLLVFGLYTVHGPLLKLSCSSLSVYAKRYFTAFLNFTDLSGTKNPALTERRIGAWAAGAWIIGTAIWRYAYSSFIIGALVLKTRAPFENLYELARTAKMHNRRLISNPGDTLLEGKVNDTVLGPLVKAALTSTNLDQTLDMVEKDQRYVYSTTDLVAFYEVNKRCDIYRVILDQSGVQQSLSIVFPKNTPFADAFTNAIVQHQNALQFQVERLSSGYRCQDISNTSYMYPLSMHHLKPVFLLLITALAINATILLAEIHWFGQVRWPGLSTISTEPVKSSGNAEFVFLLSFRCCLGFLFGQLASRSVMFRSITPKIATIKTSDIVATLR